jgi:hypothetical protein
VIEIIKDIEEECGKVQLKNFKYNPDKIYILEQNSSYGQLTRNRLEPNNYYVFKNLFATETYWTGSVEKNPVDVFKPFLVNGFKIYEFNKTEFVEWFKRTF